MFTVLVGILRVFGLSVVQDYSLAISNRLEGCVWEGKREGGRRVGATLNRCSY